MNSTTTAAEEEPPNIATAPVTTAPAMPLLDTAKQGSKGLIETHAMIRSSRHSTSSSSSSASATLMTPEVSANNIPGLVETDTEVEDGVSECSMSIRTISTSTTPTPTPTPLARDDPLTRAFAKLSARSSKTTQGGFDKEPAAMQGDIEQSMPDPLFSPRLSASADTEDESISSAAKALPPILAHDKARGVTIYDLSAHISMPITRSSSWSGRSRDSVMQEKAKCPAWAKPTVKRNSIGGTPEEIEEQAEDIKVDFGEEVLELITGSTAAGQQHMLKSKDGRVMVKTDDKEQVVYFWLPGIDKDACMISSGQESVQVQANSHERDEHFSWRVELTDGDFDIKPNASWEGPDVLRIAVTRKVYRYEQADPEIGNTAWRRLCLNVLDADTKEFIGWIWDKPTVDAFLLQDRK